MASCIFRPRGSWPDFGIPVPHGATGEVRTTCPQCSAQRRKHTDLCLAVNVEKGTWYCHHCAWKGSLQRPGDAPGMPPTGPRPQPPDDTPRKRAALRRVWRQARPVTPDDPVARYLQGRGLWQEPLPAVLRCHPRLAYRHDIGHYSHHPTMVAAVQAPEDTVVSLHRTYLTHAGEKAPVPNPKKLMPTPTTTRGAAVRLDPPGEMLAVTEGIETALAVRLSAGVPVWAAISASGMEKLVAPDIVRLVVICADHDPDGKGEKAARTLARRMLAEGRRVKILMPETPGHDWANGLEGERHV